MNEGQHSPHLRGTLGRIPPLPVSFTSFGSRLGATLRYAPPRSPPSAVGDRPAARRMESVESERKTNRDTNHTYYTKIMNKSNSGLDSLS